MPAIHHAREARKKQTAECFTPPFLTNQMLDKLTQYAPKQFWKDEGKTFLDPASGNGNMLIEVLKRKLSHKHNPLKALQTLYGTDIMADNVKECRQRLLKVVSQHVAITKDHIRAVMKNIICTPLDKYPNGSLDYDFEFKQKPSEKQVEIGFKQIHAEKRLDGVSV